MKAILTDMYSTLILTIREIFRHILSVWSHICDVKENVLMRIKTYCCKFSKVYYSILVASY